MSKATLNAKGNETMNATHVSASNLRCGDVVDLVPLIRRYAPDDTEGLMANEYGYATVEAVRLENEGPHYPAVIYTDQGNYAVPRDARVEVLELTTDRW